MDEFLESSLSLENFEDLFVDEVLVDEDTASRPGIYCIIS